MSQARDTYYNLLVQGLRAGQLSVNATVPPGLAQLRDPYDVDANAAYRWIACHPLHDLSLYRGKLFLYFGVTPALVLFWPFVALTGHYLLHKHAVVIFFAVGFLASAGVLRAVWRRYFADVGWGVVLAGALALGLAGGAPLIMARSDVYEVAISCGHAFTMLSLAALFAALHAPRRRGAWLATASLLYGLAVGARPNLLPGAVIFLVPVFRAVREQRRPLATCAAAAVPLLIVSLLLALYNTGRFDAPLEFGQRYQLGGPRQDTTRHFGLDCLWFNCRVYFLQPARWIGRLPFVRDIAVPPRPAALYWIEHPFGVLTNVPFVCLAMAAPAALRGRPAGARVGLREFLIAVVLLFATATLTLLLYDAACCRYQAEFLPHLVLLAAVGTLAAERALLGLPAWRRVVRSLWIAMLALSIAFNVGAVLERHAEAHNNAGLAMAARNQAGDAIACFNQALQIDPELAGGHYNLGVSLASVGRDREAIDQFREALRIDPELRVAARDLGDTLFHAGRVDDAIRQFRQLVHRWPDDSAAWVSLGDALAARGFPQEAERCYRQAIRIQPTCAAGMYHLGNVLADTRRFAEAIIAYEDALLVQPAYQEVHINLAVTLVELGRVEAATPHIDAAMRLASARPEAHFSLGRLLARVGRRDEAVDELRIALRLRPGYAEANQMLNTLSTRERR
ncbi:MAG: tetratricopeptide repeat protein [Planctomycetota bacterium]